MNHPETVLHVGVDGSRNGGQGGYGVYFASGLLDYGAVDPSEDPELTAIERALTLARGQRLAIHTDSNDALLRFVHGVSPRPTHAYRAQIDRAKASLSAHGADVEFVEVRQSEQQVALHAVAHLLAFLGRTRQAMDTGHLTGLVDRVLGNEQPDALAHDLVHDLLFPQSRA